MEEQIRNQLFLSCLCGSEDPWRAEGEDAVFLSCLCGSEGRSRSNNERAPFLSCLCGSEVLENSTILLIVKERYPREQTDPYWNQGVATIEKSIG